jgi:hypothetical protein
MAAIAMVWEPSPKNEVQSFHEKLKRCTIFLMFITP